MRNFRNKLRLSQTRSNQVWRGGWRERWDTLASISCLPPTIVDTFDMKQRNLGLEGNTGGHVSKVNKITVLCLPSHRQSLQSPGMVKGKGGEVCRKEAVLSPDCHLDPQNWDKSQPVAVSFSFCNALAHEAQLEDGKID